jgi:hypothetical protein
MVDQYPSHAWLVSNICTPDLKIWSVALGQTPYGLYTFNTVGLNISSTMILRGAQGHPLRSFRSTMVIKNRRDQRQLESFTPACAPGWLRNEDQDAVYI